MVLPYLAQEAIDDIKMNFFKYRAHFSDPTPSWFIAVFEENGWWRNSKVRYDAIDLDMSEDFNTSDRRNIERVYTGLRGLSPAPLPRTSASGPERCSGRFGTM